MVSLLALFTNNFFSFVKGATVTLHQFDVLPLT